MCRVLNMHPLITGILMGPNCPPLHSNFFRVSYKTELKQTLSKDERITEAKVINLTFGYSVC